MLEIGEVFDGNFKPRFSRKLSLDWFSRKLSGLGRGRGGVVLQREEDGGVAHLRHVVDAGHVVHVHDDPAVLLLVVGGHVGGGVGLKLGEG